jgi:5-methylcytosine-specific restriction endonuclease McrA
MDPLVCYQPPQKSIGKKIVAVAGPKLPTKARLRDAGQCTVSGTVFIGSVVSHHPITA